MATNYNIKQGAPSPSEGSDGATEVRWVSNGLFFFVKYKGKWYSRKMSDRALSLGEEISTTTISMGNQSFSVMNAGRLYVSGTFGADGVDAANFTIPASSIGYANLKSDANKFEIQDSVRSVDIGLDGSTEYLKFLGTANEVEAVLGGTGNRTLTIGLPSNVSVAGIMSAPTIDTVTIRHTNNTEALTIDASGNLTSEVDHTVDGTLDVTGITTLTGALDANSTADIANTLTLSKGSGTGLSVTANATVGGTLGVTGLITGTGGISLENFSVANDTGDTVITGNLTVQGTTTTINSTTLTVDDKNIELGSVDTPTDITAHGGGITLKGDDDKTILWDKDDNSWHYNQAIYVNQPSASGYAGIRAKRSDGAQLQMISGTATETFDMRANTDSSSSGSEYKTWLDLTPTTGLSHTKWVYFGTDSDSVNIGVSDLNTSLFTGTGWGIKNDGYKSSFYIDDLWVRGKMTVWELVINQIRATNGSLVVTSAAKIGAVSRVGGGDTFAVTDTIEFTAESEGFDIHPFAINDLILAHKMDVAGGTITDHRFTVSVISVTESLSGTVTATNGSDVIEGASTAFTTDLQVGDALRIASSVAGGKEDFIVEEITDNDTLTVDSNYQGTTASSLAITKGTANKWRAVCDTDSSVGAVSTLEGQTFVRIGNTTDGDRQGGLYLTSDDADSPFIDVWDEVDSWGDWQQPGMVKTRIGRLDGVSNTTNEFGIMAGEGFTANTHSFIKASNAGVQLYNAPIQLFEGTTRQIVLSPGNTGGGDAAFPYLAIGSDVADGVWSSSDKGFLVEQNASDHINVSIGKVDGTYLTYRSQTGVLQLKGSINIVPGGWTDDDDAAGIVANAATAAAAALAASNAASDASGEAVAAQGELDDIADDDKVTPSEKVPAKLLFTTIESENSGIRTQATAQGISLTNFDADYNSLVTYIEDTIAVFDSMTTTTSITRADWDTQWGGYYDEKQTLLNAIAADAETKADTAKGAADDAQSAADDAQGAADDAQGDADLAQGELDDIADDTKVTPAEKYTVKVLYTAITGEYTGIINTAAGYDPAVSSTAYANAYAALVAYLGVGEMNVFGDMTDTTTIVRATWEAEWGLYYSTKQTLLDALAGDAEARLVIADGVADQAAADVIINAAAALAAQNELDDIADDTKVTPSEKEIAYPLYYAIYNEQAGISAGGTTQGVSTTAFDNAYTALYNYINTTTTLFSDISATTTIVRADWNTAWNTYYDERSSLLTLMAADAEAKADTAQSAAATADGKAVTAQSAIDAIEVQAVLAADGLELRKANGKKVAKYGSTSTFYDGSDSEIPKLILNASGVSLYGDATNLKLQVASTGVTMYGDDIYSRAVVSSTGMDVYEDDVGVAHFGAAMRIGEVAAGKSNIIISGGTMQFRVNEEAVIELNTDGDAFIAGGVKIGAGGSSFSEVEAVADGAETPAGATEKAAAAQAAAEAAAALDATSKADTAESNAATDATSKADTAESNAATDATSKANTAESNAATDATSKANTAESNAATDATSKANTAESNAATDATSKANTAESNAATDATSKANTAESNAASDATSKANTAQSNAESTASSDATSKANTAESNAASDATSKANTAQSNAESTASSDATSKANTAQSNAESTASSDATSKANTAQSNAESTASSDATSKANTAQSNAESTASGDATTKANAAADASLDKTTYLSSGEVTIDGGKITAYSVDAVQLGADIISGGKIIAGLLTADNITTGSLNTSKINFASAGGNVFLTNDTPNNFLSSNCVMLGYNAGTGIIAGGNDNTGIGDSALNACTGGRQNTCVGANAGLLITGDDGDNNICIGYNAGANITSGSGNVVIGSAETPAADSVNQLVITSGNVDNSPVVWMTGNSSGVVDFPHGASNVTADKLGTAYTSIGAYSGDSGYGNYDTLINTGGTQGSINMGGVTLKWGRIEGYDDNDLSSNEEVTFSTPFDNSCQNVQVTYDILVYQDAGLDGGGIGSNVMAVTYADKTSFSVSCSSDVEGIFWFAVGN